MLNLQVEDELSCRLGKRKERQYENKEQFSHP